MPQENHWSIGKIGTAATRMWRISLFARFDRRRAARLEPGVCLCLLLHLVGGHSDGHSVFGICSTHTDPIRPSMFESYDITRQQTFRVVLLHAQYKLKNNTEKHYGHKC